MSQNMFRELIYLVDEYIEGDTNMTEDEIRNRTQDYYDSGFIEGTQYDYVLRLLES